MTRSRSSPSVLKICTCGNISIRASKRLNSMRTNVEIFGIPSQNRTYVFKLKILLCEQKRYYFKYIRVLFRSFRKNILFRNFHLQSNNFLRCLGFNQFRYKQFYFTQHCVNTVANLGSRSFLFDLFFQYFGLE